MRDFDFHVVAEKSGRQIRDKHPISTNSRSMRAVRFSTSIVVQYCAFSDGKAVSLHSQNESVL